MTRSRAVSALVVAVSCVLAASRAAEASDAFRTTVTFSKPVQLADGSVLQANTPYEFQINFAGTGNTAEFEFMLIGGKNVKQPAEAVGFSAALKAGWNLKENAKLRMAGPSKWDYYAREGESQDQKHKGDIEWAKIKFVNPQDEYKYKVFEGDLRTAGKHIGKAVLYVKIKSAVPAGQASTESFSWGAAGFGPNTHPRATEEGGVINVVVPSSNSPAFFKSQINLSPAKPAPAPMKKPPKSQR